MRIARYQVNNVIKSYMEHMKIRASRSADEVEELVLISDSGKNLLLQRIEEHTSARARKQLRR